MSFFIRHRYDDDQREPPIDSLAGWLAELDERPEDVEHDSVSMTPRERLDDRDLNRRPRHAGERRGP